MLPSLHFMVVSICRNKFFARLFIFPLLGEAKSWRSEANWWWNKVMRIRVAQEKWWFHIIWGNGYWNWYMLSCQSISFILKTDHLRLKTSYMDESACLWKQLKWNKFLFYGDKLSGKNYSRGLGSPDSVSEKVTQEEQSALIRRQVVWWNYSEQLIEKQVSVETCTKSTKRETFPIYGSRCTFDQNRNGYPYKAGMSRLKPYKSSKLLLWKFIL